MYICIPKSRDKETVLPDRSMDGKIKEFLQKNTNHLFHIDPFGVDGNKILFNTMNK